MVVPAPSRSPTSEGSTSSPSQGERGRTTGSPNRWSPVLATSPLYHRHLLLGRTPHLAGEPVGRNGSAVLSEPAYVRLRSLPG